MIIGKEPRAIEPIAIMDALATDVEAVEDLGNGLRRVIFTAPEGRERHITAKVVMTEADLLAIIRKLGIQFSN